METKGEWPKKLVINQRQTDIGFLDNMGLFVPIHTKELATEVIYRYNSHPALLAACEDIVEFCYPHGNWRGYTNMKGLCDAIQPIRAAIEAAKPK